MRSPIRSTESLLSQDDFPDKQIFWMAEEGHFDLHDGGRRCFPDYPAIFQRKNAEFPTPLVAFGRAVSEARQRVFIMDKFFLAPERGSRQNLIQKILEWIPDDIIAHDIRFVIKSQNSSVNGNIDKEMEDQFTEHAEKINAKNLNRNYPIEIQLRFCLGREFDHLHDRFAIVDDELWHFGATVGGFHSQVTAATRGWKASECGADEFFKIVWDAQVKKGKANEDF